MTCRWQTRVGTALVGMALVGTLAGCGGAGSSGSGLPERPAELRVDGITDACVLLTADQQTLLGVGRPRPGTAPPDELRQGPDCIWSNFPQSRLRVGYLAMLVSNQGAEWALGQKEPPRSVDGYAATTGASAIFPVDSHCLMLVDIAPGQSLLVQYDNDSRDIPGMTHAKACDKAQEAASLMLVNLRAHQR